MCLAFKEQTSKVIFRFVVPFANRLANLRLADWLANLQIGQIGRLVGTCTCRYKLVDLHDACDTCTCTSIHYSGQKSVYILYNVDLRRPTSSYSTEKADLLARAFSSQCSNPHRYTSQHTPAAFHDTPFDVPQLTGDEVFWALRTLPAYKATGGTIPNRLIKETAPVITESLCYLFNLSLSLGQLSNDWKIATAVPLLKPKSLASNPVTYRPISLLPCIANVLDHLVCNHLLPFCTSTKSSHLPNTGLFVNVPPLINWWSLQTTLPKH